MIDILHRVTKAILYHSETAQTIAEAVAGANLQNTDLRGADLMNTNLMNTNLMNTNLMNANLCGADLTNTNLCVANLRNADLRDANLSGADLWDADLRDADLRDANLSGANLTGANLINAKNYVNSHDMFAEVVRRQHIETFTTAEWAAIGQIIVYQLCWKNIYPWYGDVAPHMLDVLAEAGFTEWREHWAMLRIEIPDAE